MKLAHVDPVTKDATIEMTGAELIRLEATMRGALKGERVNESGFAETDVFDCICFLRSKLPVAPEEKMEIVFKNGSGYDLFVDIRVFSEDVLASSFFWGHLDDLFFEIGPKEKLRQQNTDLLDIKREWKKLGAKLSMEVQG